MLRISQATQLPQFTRTLAILFAAMAGVSGLRAADNLQDSVNRMMKGKAGAVIVSDPRTGRVLALWNPQGALKEAYSPGSTAMLVASAAALEEGIISPAERHPVPPSAAAPG